MKAHKLIIALALVWISACVYADFVKPSALNACPSPAYAARFGA